MATYYAKRALEILWEEGPIELSRATGRFFARRTIGEERQLKYRTYKTHLFNRVKFDAVAPPFQPINMEVNEVNWCTAEVSFSKTFGQILGGEWDQTQELTPVEKKWIVNGLEEKFQEGKCWEETAYVSHIKENYFDENKQIWGASNTEEFIQKRCRYVENIYQDIIENGYQPEHELNENAKYDGRSKYSQKLEPLVVIGRGGEVIWRDGYHRFALAKIADIEKIPVQVVCRHKQWQELRDEIHNNGLPEGREDLRDHPDLRDVLD